MSDDGCMFTAVVTVIAVFALAFMALGACMDEGDTGAGVVAGEVEAGVQAGVDPTPLPESSFAEVAGVCRVQEGEVVVYGAEVYTVTDATGESHVFHGHLVIERE